MTIQLEPPYTRGGMFGIENHEPVLEGPLLVRTRGMSRWHRVKSGVRFTDQAGRICWHLWCGQAASSTATIGRDTLPTDGLPICGPCEGKALGAGYNGTAAIVNGEALLLFEPESQTKYRRPAVCPGARMTNYLPAQVDSDGSIGRCAACGLHTATTWRRRGRGYSYNGWETLKDHAPGPALVEPCPFHAWDELALHNDQAVCACTLRRQETPE